MTPLGDAAMCRLPMAQLNDATTCESSMRTAPDDTTQSACVYTPAPAVTSQCELMLQTGFDCATWMCADPVACPYSGFCDRTCDLCLTPDGGGCTPLGADQDFYTFRSMTGGERCRGGSCAVVSASTSNDPNVEPGVCTSVRTHTQSPFERNKREDGTEE